jgi:hypothetical protein
MATFAFLAAMPFALLAALYFTIKSLYPDQQDWIVDHARFRSR